ncbi:hypothetical protein BJY04DRAFT_45605 [Aspergillus karnatakaensis]|uniref:uncharacterized protein n=1 Tax=Aspergillus karnatakaensis TaxID=1810916 RepID=UPI003CCD08C6
MAAPDEEVLVPHFHPPKPLPFELVQHVAIFFEEKLHTQALSLLLNALSAHPDASTPVYVPSPQHLSLAATFLVHPSTTGRPKTTEEEEAPTVSLRLLRLVNNLVGPTGAQFNTAFLFTHFETSRHGGRRHVDDGRPSSMNRSADGERKPLNLDRDIPIDLAQSASVWSRAEDFWHAVGWAFNCAVLHPTRWERWRVWLEFMCQVLEEDWEEHLREKREDLSSDPRKDSLIVHYITKSSHGFGRNRRILRSIFADGSTTAVNEFREVFHKELKLSKKRTAKGKGSKNREAAAAVDIDAEEYGDFYLTTDHEDEDGSSGRESKRPRRSKETRSRRTAASAATLKPKLAVDTPEPDPTLSSSLLGDMTSLALRQRLLHLLSTVSQTLPNLFMDLQDLYHLLVENIRPLPLPIFQAFVSPFALPYFSPAAHSTLCEFLLFRLRESAAPDTDDEYLTQSKIEVCFLPYAAATPSISDNTKMSITLETLIMLLADSDMLQVTEETKRLAKTGIIRRAEKAQAETRKNQFTRRSEDLEWSWLGESAERLMFLVEEVVPISGKDGIGGSGSGTGDPSVSPSSRSSSGT